MRRRAYLWLAGLALVALALLLTDRLLWQPGLTEDNVRRLRPGMSLAEVEGLLGGPAAGQLRDARRLPGLWWQREWHEGSEVVVVQFFADGRVMSATGRGRPQPGPIARLRAWLGW